MLTDRYLHGIPADSRASKPNSFLKAEHVTEDALNNVRQLNDIAKQRGQSLAQMALAWVLRGGRVTSVLIGASKVSQLNENVAALIEQYRGEALGWKLSGAGGGGYLILVADHPIKNGIRVLIRRKSD